LGDFVWIGKTNDGEELVLDTIVERKQVTDLVASLKDRRYKGTLPLVKCLLNCSEYMIDTFGFGGRIRTKVSIGQVGNRECNLPRRGRDPPSSIRSRHYI
jgi:hypothetical protein